MKYGYYCRFAIIFILLNVISLSLTESSLHNEKLCDTLIAASNMSSYEEEELISEFNANFPKLKEISKYCIERLLLTGKYETLENYLDNLYLENIRFSQNLSNAVSNIETMLQQIKEEYRYVETKKITKPPAFQWAQSLNKVFIEIKYSSSFTSPGCLEVSNFRLSVKDNNKMTFQAKCFVDSEQLIQFELVIELFGNVENINIVNDKESGSKYLVILNKKADVFWERLLKGSEKEFNMKEWFEMKIKYKDELKNFYQEEEEEEKSYDEIEKELKEEKKKKKKKGKKKRNKKTKNSDL